MPGTVYLMYHELERPGRPLCGRDPGYVRYAIPEDRFRDQIRAIRHMDIRAVSVGDALRNTLGRIIVLTFDDGCESDWLMAAPILRGHAFNATFYITSGCLGRTGFLSAAQLRSLAEDGFEIGCHGATHRFLPHLSNDELRAEIVDAKQRLEDVIGRPVMHFSCPGGRWDRRVIESLRAAAYASMAISCPGVNDGSSKPFQLRRIPLRRSIDLRRFNGICRGEVFFPWMEHTVLDGAKRCLGESLYGRLRSLGLGTRHSS